LPSPFFLVATQNPYETTGTFPLVEGQLDRFCVVTHIGPPDPATERRLLLGEGGEDALTDLSSVSDPTALADAIATVRTIHCAPSVADYVIALANATRSHPDVAIGASPRSSLALIHAAQAHALLAGRSYVVPDDVKRLCVPVIAHRLLLRDAATLREAQTFLSTLVEGVAVPHP
jgi:MoxR-like ATPase